jgi:DNA repair protein SbcC/Rad50
MRPLKLEVEGFTSFRERLTLDLSGLDLFAITGATGAGKSSLIDALVFALYGQVPRVGKEYRQLISHQAERLSVLLEFEVGGRGYRIARSARANNGPVQVRLEHRNGKGWESSADRVKEIEAEVVKIVGLDYDAFTRSVVLPQGQFDAFLKGEPKERRKILVALLNLGVYEDMHRIANARAAEARREAEFIAGQLAVDFKDATEEALAARVLGLAEAEKGACGLESAQAALAEGLEMAGRVRAARRELATLLRDLEGEQAKVGKAEVLLAEADRKREGLEREAKEVAEALSACGFDAERHGTLLGARPRVESLADVAPKAARLGLSVSDKGSALDGARAALAEADRLRPKAESAVAEARAALEAARAERDGLRRRHSAVELRRHLKAGGACPVCEQTVKTVPRGTASGLEAAEAAVGKAEAAERATVDALGQARVGVERARGESAGLEKELAQVEAQRKETAEACEALRTTLGSAGWSVADLADPKALLAALGRELKALEAARTERDRLEGRRRALENERAGGAASLAAARAEAESARTRAAELSSRRGAAQLALDSALTALAALAKRASWDGLAGAAAGRDEVDALEARRAAVQREAADLAGTIARLRAEAQQIERKIARAAELQQKKKALEASGALAQTLAQHLRADQFLAYVQEEALRLLAEDGSRHLHMLSQGRYSLVCEEQEFAVLDHWNADSRRSVKTLSGGETFLASLALALALAESLARLSAEGRAGEALESLFLDEGFGALDAETLDVVVQAIEALQGGQRMVGIVTHIPELAERMPARLEVRRGPQSATVAIA